MRLKGTKYWPEVCDHVPCDCNCDRCDYAESAMRGKAWYEWYSFADDEMKEEE